MSAASDTGITPVLNPGATIVPFEAGGAICFSVDAPVRGEGLRRTRVTPTETPVMHRLLTGVALAPGSGSISVASDELEVLRTAGLLVDPRLAPERLTFHTPLPRAEAASDGLCVNPAIVLADAEASAPSAPEAWSRIARAEAARWAWIDDPVRGIPFCFWLTAKEAEAVRGLVESSVSPVELESDLRGALLAVGALIDPEAREVAQLRWDASIAEARESLASAGYAGMPRLLPQPIAEAVSRYYGAAADGGFLFADVHGSFLYGHHNEPLAAWLHQHIFPVLGRVIPEPVKPSYAFVAVYEEGGELRPHTDRVQCEYTLSIAAGSHAPIPGLPLDPWPLYLETCGGTVEARPGLGDAVLFKGREIPHFRPRLECAELSVSVLLHFVPEGFDGPLD